MIWYYTIQRATLEIISEGPGFALSELLGEKKPSLEASAYTKVLTMARLDVVSFRQLMVGKPYKTPLVIQAIGIGGELIGVMVRIFNTKVCNFGDSLLLLPPNPLIKVLKVSLESTKSGSSTAKKQVSVEDYKEKFKIIELLEDSGFDMILNKALKDFGSSDPKITRTKLLGGSARVACLENYAPLADLLSSRYNK